MATDPLLDAADRLYGLTLAEFTPARDALVKEHKADKDLAAALKALKKPSLAAWVVNLLVRRDAAQVDQVLVVGAALRQAQADLDGAELRQLTRQRRQLTAAVTAQARGLAAEHGQRVTQAVADQVEATLTAAMVDPAAAAAVRTGLLVNALRSTGLGELDLTAYVAVPDAADFTPTELDEPAPPPPPDLHVVPDPDAASKKLRRGAGAPRRPPRRRSTRPPRRSTAADADVAELEARSLQVQAEIDELRRRLGELESDQDDIDEQLADAREVASSARQDVSTADAARARAEAAVARLDS